MSMGRLLRRQWRKRPGRALATAASVAETSDDETVGLMVVTAV